MVYDINYMGSALYFGPSNETILSILWCFGPTCPGIPQTGLWITDKKEGESRLIRKF